MNPYWYPHDLYDPGSVEEGGPFTIGRVIHVSRGVGFLGYIGGVAVFDIALSQARMKEFADLSKGPDGVSSLLMCAAS